MAETTAGDGELAPQPTPVEFGELIHIDALTASGIDETFGVPREIAARVEGQVLVALARQNIDPDTVVFSGYYDRTDADHRQKAEGQFVVPDESTLGDAKEEYDPYYDDDSLIDSLGSFAVSDATLSARDTGRYTYFFCSIANLASEEGAIAHAATGENPAIGVYDRTALVALGYNDIAETVDATPHEIKTALLFEFVPRYRKEE